MKFKIKFADQVVGLFIILALALFVAIIVLLGMNQRWFAKDYKFKSNFSSASNIAPGTAIMMKGFTVGKIDAVTLNEENTVDVEFHIFDTFYDKVHEYSILELTVSPIGLGSQLLFHPGRGEALLPEGAFIPRMDSPEGEMIIEQELVEIPVKDDTITRLLSGINPLIENVNKTVVTINRTLTEVNRALAGQSAGPLGDIFIDVSDATARLPGVVANVDGVIGGVNDQIAVLMAQLSGVVDDVEGIMDQVSSTVSGVDAAIGQVSSVVDQVSGTIAGADSIVAELDKVAVNVEQITANLEATTAAIRDPTGLVPRLLDPSGSIKTLLDDDNELFRNLQGIIGEVEALVDSVQGIVQALGTEMPKVSLVLNETRAAIENASSLLETIEKRGITGILGGSSGQATQESLGQSLR